MGSFRNLVIVLFSLLPGWTSAATIDTIAGTGKPGFSGDGDKATTAQLHQPFHCDLDGKGNLYVAEANNHCVRKIDLKTGIISTVAGCGIRGYTGDDGLAIKAAFNEPYAVAVTVEGDLYIVDRLNAVTRRVDGKTGVVTTVAGNGIKGFSGDGGKATEAMLREPNDCCLDGKGGLLIADVADWRIRRLNLKTGVITTFAGSGKQPGMNDRARLGDDGPAEKAVIAGARAVCVDGQGNTYICEREGNAIRKVDARGIITTIAGSGAKGAADGLALRATFNGPKGIRCDAAGNAFVVDTENHSIRKVDVKAGTVATIAGGRKGSAGDGGDPLKAGLDRPHGCILDRDGTLYIADSGNNRVRRVKP